MDASIKEYDVKADEIVGLKRVLKKASAIHSDSESEDEK